MHDYSNGFDKFLASSLQPSTIRLFLLKNSHQPIGSLPLSFSSLRLKNGMISDNTAASPEAWIRRCILLYLDTGESKDTADNVLKISTIKISVFNYYHYWYLKYIIIMKKRWWSLTFHFLTVINTSRTTEHQPNNHLVLFFFENVDSFQRFSIRLTNLQQWLDCYRIMD